jgi:hypothetical protein
MEINLMRRIETRIFPFLLSTIFFLYPTDSIAQYSFERTYGGFHYDVGHSVQQTSDGGYIITGIKDANNIHSPSTGNIYLIKTNASGDTLWTKTFGGSAADWGYSVQQTLDGGYIITGHTESFGAGLRDVYLIKTDALGNAIWTRTYGGSNGDEGNSVQQTSDGGYIITGHTESFGAGLRDVYLLDKNLWGFFFG